MKTIFSFLLLVGLVILPCISYSATVDLTGDTGYLFDLDISEDGSDEYGGDLYNGTSDAYDRFYRLAVGTSPSSMSQYYSSSALSYTQSGRTVTLETLTINGLEVTRKFYVPSSDSFTNADWGRYLDCIRNPGASTVTVNVAVGSDYDFGSWDFQPDTYSDLGSDGSTIITDTSDGDTTFETTDTWFATDDDDNGSGDPSLGHVIQGPGAPYSVTTVDDRISDTDAFTWIFEGVSIGAGQTACFLTFAVQADDDSAAQAAAAALVGLPAAALAGLSKTEMANVVNFDIQQESVSVPTMNEWGLLILIVFSGCSGAYYLRKKGMKS